VKIDKYKNSHQDTKAQRGKDRSEEARKRRREEKSNGKKFLVSCTGVSWWQSFHGLRATAGWNPKTIKK